MYAKNNQPVFKTIGYHMNESRNINKFEKIMHRTLRYEKSPSYSCERQLTLYIVHKLLLKQIL